MRSPRTELAPTYRPPSGDRPSPGGHHHRGLAPPRERRPGPGRPAARHRHRIGVLAPETVPAYVGDRQAEEVLARIANDIGITTGEILACHRYAISGDVRAMGAW
ncbi:hypothetical protein AB0C76_14805 [Kitasatospora sp. NPDC048722]|uniref:hypothetical protein n=1 Tax=Kitasatospora sp. NPDC048722 TaxID=3155639 RepID=UPI0033CC1323